MAPKRRTASHGRRKQHEKHRFGLIVILTLFVASATSSDLDRRITTDTADRLKVLGDNDVSIQPSDSIELELGKRHDVITKDNRLKQLQAMSSALTEWLFKPSNNDLIQATKQKRGEMTATSREMTAQKRREMTATSRELKPYDAICNRICTVCQQVISRRWSALCHIQCETGGQAYDTCVIVWVNKDQFSDLTHTRSQ